MDLSKELLLVFELRPLTVFVYGSRAKGDFHKESDYEIGVIFEDKKFFDRKYLSSLVNNKKISIYSFKYSTFFSGKLNTPYNKNLYFYDILLNNKVIYGENIFLNIEKPDLFLLDLLTEIKFNIGLCFSGVISFREGNLSLSYNLLFKSFFYGLRIYLIFSKNIFLSNYNSSYLEYIDNDFKFISILEKLYFSRKNYDFSKLILNDFYENLKFLKFVEEELLLDFENKGNYLLNLKEKNVL